jgi:hypothetical protein
MARPADSGGEFRSPSDLLHRLGIETPEEIDIEAIAQFCGATIVYETLFGCEARIVGHGDQAIITVNAGSPEYRRRFSAGHELGHWIRDRGKVAFACTNSMLKGEWSADNPEKRANDYAAALLLPERMFSADARGREITFATVEEVAGRYRTSRTATAIRLVELGSYPSMVICTRLGKRWKWLRRSSDWPGRLWPLDEPRDDTHAYDLLRGAEHASLRSDVAAAGWFDLDDAERASVHEDSVRLADGLVLSLLWWRDESQLIRLGRL